MFTSELLSTIVLVASFVTHQVAANWDPATGHLRDFKPTAEWIAAHQRRSWLLKKRPRAAL